MADEVEEEQLPCDTAKSAEITEAEQHRLDLEESLRNQNVWGYSELGKQAQKAAMSMLSTKHGMYARIPLICKGDDCPYKDSCHLLGYNLSPVGEYCPIETAQIESRYFAYAEDFELENSSFTDRNLISEIINLDIMSERCKALISKEAVPVIEVVSGISEQGESYSHPEVSKYWEVYERVQKRRNELYQLMMATRRDKKDKKETTETIHEIIANVIATESKGGFIIDQCPTDMGGDEK